MPSAAAVRANACNTLLIDHQVMNAASARRVPQRSTRIPEIRYMIVYAYRNPCRIPAYWTGVRPSSLVSTGATTGTYNVGATPIGICFDGVYIWVTNHSDSTVTRL